MPVRRTTRVDIREQIALLALSGRYGITEIAERFDVSRPTVYLYRDRFLEHGRAGLTDRSRAPHTGKRIGEGIRQRVIEERVRFGFGAKKIRRRMFDDDPEGHWPARSTIEKILQAEGLVHRRRRRPAYRSPFRQRFEVTEPGQLQTIDFKGEFRLRSGRWCRPLTMTDSFSRYLLACEALPTIHLSLVWPVVERVFREHGLPAAMLSDNGSPFGAHGIGRFSAFAVRLMELGIQPVFIAPGHPEQNGSHERMHRTLLESPLFERATSFRHQQRIFDAFRTVYNYERPHEGIAMVRPAHRHRISPRPYPATIAAVEYPEGFEIRRVDSNGSIRWRNRSVQISTAFSGRAIGLELVDEDLWDVYFSTFLIGRFDERERRFV
jgi:putative transposase